MIQIAICDDEQTQRSVLKRVLIPLLDLRAISYTLYEFSDGESLLRSFRDCMYDIIFLDIEMGGLNGVDTAKQIRLLSKKVLLIFVTAYPDFVFQGYEVQAFQYILKPYTTQKVSKILDDVLEEIRLQEDCYLAIFQKSGTYKLNLNDTLYFISDRRLIHAITATKDFEFYEKMDDLEQRLPEYFIRIHQRYLVNLNYITSTKDTSVFLNDIELPISRSHKQNFLVAFAKTMLR